MGYSKTGVTVGGAILIFIGLLLPFSGTGLTITGDRAELGKNYDIRFGVADTRHHSSFELPSGRLRIGVDAPLASLTVADGSSYDKESLLAPRNGGFVRVAWDLESSYDEVETEYSTDSRPSGFDSLTLIADGTRYLLALGRTDSSASTAWAVPGKGKNVKVEVEYDGVTQTLDARTGKRTVGRAASLYDVPATRQGTCGQPTIARPFATPATDPDRDPNFTCEYQVRRLRYVTGAGWAPAGKAWLVVETKLDPARDVSLVFAGRTTDYSVEYADDATSRLQGRDGTQARGEYSDSDYGTAVYWPVPIGAALPSSLTFEQSLSVVPSARKYDRDQEDQELDLSWTVPLR